MKKGLGYLLLIIGLLCGLQVHAAQVPKPSIAIHVKYADEHFKQGVYKIVHVESEAPGVKKEVDSYTKDENYFGESETCENSTVCVFSSAKKRYHQFIFVYDDHSETSPAIELDSYHSSFDLQVAADGEIEIKETTPWFLRLSKPYSMYRTAILSVLVEVLVLWLVLLLLRYPDKKRFLLAMLLANLIALPVFFGLMELSDSSMMWFLGEVVMIAIETVFVWWFMQKAATLGKMALLVFLLNLFSVFAGGAVLFFAKLFGQDIIQYLH